MKKIISRNILVKIIGLFLFIAFARPVVAGTAELSWDANSETDLAGYRIYYDTVSHSATCPLGYANSIDVGKVTAHTLSDLQEGHVYYFQLTALDESNNESTCSSVGEVNKVITYRGDLDENRNVDIFDYSALVTNFGQNNCGNKADIDGNCTVNIFDYSILLSDFGKNF